MTKIKQFKSKKNNVSLVYISEKPIIKKVFTDELCYHKEKDIYQNVLMHGECNAPKLIKYDDNDCRLLLEYVMGETVLSIIEKAEVDNDINLASCVIISLVEWLERFSQLLYIKKNGLCYFDVNLRNFIYLDGTIYGIDFEEVQLGSFRQDIVKVLAMLLCYDPKYSEFKCKVCEKVSRYLVDRGWFDQETLDSYITKEIEVINMRRSKKNKRGCPKSAQTQYC